MYRKSVNLMYVDFYRASSPAHNFEIELNCIYRLYADESYQVVHPPFEPTQYVLVVTTAGCGYIDADNRKMLLSAGDVVLLAARERLSYHCAAQRWDFWWFEITTKHPLEGLYRVSSVLLDEWITGLCSRAFSCFKEKNFDTAASYTAALLCCVMDAAVKHGDAANPAQTRFSQAEEYLNRHLSSVTVSALARQVHVSTRTLANDFHVCAGCTPHEYIQQKRLSCAKYMLKNTMKTVTEIAEELGYSSPFHFSKAFKAATGSSPLAFRKSSR